MTNPLHIEGFLLLRIRGTKILLVVSHPKYDSGRDHEEWLAHQKYYFEEHTCPTNVVPVECIIDGNDHDPHGIFEFVAWKPRPADFDEDECNYDWCGVFPEIPS